ncbi:antitoxin AF2212-like protein [Treponema zioleckii]|uniref:antitoxin AF2212-like protein n=1 Tax=Treponema zioleckii TaxID=331680 RepID=UPI00168BE986|nr:antitoxin AF2212-like protein [Treponema zioleckii]
MMTAIKAYYDGKSFIPLQKYTFKPRQNVLIVVDEDEDKPVSPVQRFLNLSWQGDESADEILSLIEKNRVNSERFEETNELFD